MFARINFLLHKSGPFQSAHPCADAFHMADMYFKYGYYTKILLYFLSRHLYTNLWIWISFLICIFQRRIFL